MKKIKIVFIFYLIFSFIILNFNFISFGAYNPVTKDNLSVALYNYSNSFLNTENYQISVTDTTITIKNATENYTIYYNLTDKPTFSYSIPVNQGMSYAEYEKISDYLFSWSMVIYSAIANVQGVSYENSVAYYTYSFLASAFSSAATNITNSTKYMIVSSTENTNLTDSTFSIINENDFGNHVMEYTDYLYGTKTTLSDNIDSDTINSYSFSIEEKNKTATSCSLETTLTINPTADFSKLNSYLSSINPFKDITETTANYVIKLKTGQKCILNSDIKYDSYIFYNSDYIKLNGNEITALKPGVVQGYIYFDLLNNIKKSFYILIEDNPTNSAFDPISVNISLNNQNSTKNPQATTLSTPFVPITTNTTTSTPTTTTTTTTNTTTSQTTNTVANTTVTNTMAPATSTGYSTTNITAIPNAGLKTNKAIYICYTTLTLSILGLYIFYKNDNRGNGKNE